MPTQKTMILKKFDYKIEDVDTKQGIVKIAVSAFDNKDSDGDIIVKGAWKKTITENLKRIKHLYNHDTRILLGLPQEMFETDNHLIAISKMNMSKQISKDVFSDYEFFAQNDRTIEHSVGFVPIISENLKEGGNIFKENKLYEYSTLSFLGANENTPLFELKEMLKYDYTDERLKQIEILISKIEKLEKEFLALQTQYNQKNQINPPEQLPPDAIGNTVVKDTIDYDKITNNLNFNFKL